MICAWCHRFKLKLFLCWPFKKIRMWNSLFFSVKHFGARARLREAIWKLWVGHCLNVDSTMQPSNQTTSQWLYINNPSLWSTNTAKTRPAAPKETIKASSIGCKTPICKTRAAVCGKALQRQRKVGFWLCKVLFCPCLHMQTSDFYWATGQMWVLLNHCDGWRLFTSLLLRRIMPFWWSAL